MIGLLRERGNDVLVVLGPFNEHMLEEKSRETYGDRRRAVEAWLEGQGIPHFAPALLPSELYADASHPLAGGYAQLAQQLLANEAFVRFLGGSVGRTATQHRPPRRAAPVTERLRFQRCVNIEIVSAGTETRRVEDPPWRAKL